MGSSKSKNAPQELAAQDREAHQLNTINEEAEEQQERGQNSASRPRNVRIKVVSDDGKEKELKRGSASSAPTGYERLQSGVDQRGQDIAKVLRFTSRRYQRVCISFVRAPAFSLFLLPFALQNLRYGEVAYTRQFYFPINFTS